MRLLRLLANRKLTVVAILLLAGFLYGLHDQAQWMLSLPFALLALNLLAAIIVEPGLRKKHGLFVFHLSLLLLLLLAAFGRLSRFEANLEIVEGGVFNINNLSNVTRGPLHFGRLEQLSFMQGKYSVEYADDLQRGATRSEVILPDAQGRSIRKFVGDDKPLSLHGYQFYTTSNKGFAVVLTWLPKSGQPITGALHLPSFPRFDWRQVNSWLIPGTEKSVNIELMIPDSLRQQLEKRQSWQLLSQSAKDAWLKIKNADKTIILHRGEQITLANGKLRFDEVRGWMGYKIYYDPTLLWLFISAVCGVLGLLWYYYFLFPVLLLPTTLEKPLIAGMSTKQSV